ncbi:MAG: M42 family metallopeptidase [Pirellulales bacterium]|nr:M42 family metallopeptidase [Pirellulales bacterium]
MDDRARKFLRQLLETPSPSGYERPVQDLVRAYVADFAEKVTTDLHGNVIAAANTSAPLRLMFAGHCDQIGLLVQHVDGDGFIYVQPIGGWDVQVLIGQKMTIWTDGGPVQGIIARKAIHLLTDEERKQIPKMKDLWIDIGAKNKEEVLSIVRIGDPVTLDLDYRDLRNNMAFSPAMDDKCGLWVVLEAMRRACQKKLRCALYAVSTVQEEIGLRGAKTSSHSIDPQVGIAVDVTHATDCPTVDKKEEGDVALGKGPVIARGPNMNPRVVERLLRAAEEKKIPYQIVGESRATGTDANAMQVNRGGMATGLVSIANRYMHSPVEMISLEDIDHAADLLAEFALSIDAESDFVP